MIWVLSPLTFVSISTTIALLLCEIMGSLSTEITVISLLAGFFAALWSYFKFKNQLPKVAPLSYFDSAMVLLFVIFCFRHFIWLIYSLGGTVSVLDPSNYGDLPHHIAYINFFSRGAHFWPINPLLEGDSFSYPFGIDLFSAFFTKLGVSFLYYLPLMGMAFSALFVLTLLFWGGGFAVGSFLFAGGGLGYLVFATHILKNYQDGKPWGTIILLFTTQRGFLYAFPAGLLLLWSWRRRFFSESPSESGDEKPLPQYVEGLLWGTMPIFHLHTFIFLSLCYAWWFTSTRRYNSYRVFLWAVIPATIEVYLMTDHFARRSILWWHPGWMIDNENFFLFFWNNYGLWVPLTIATIIAAWKKPAAWRQLMPAALMYVICMYVMFTPWVWDNIKLMIWSYILAVPLMKDLALDALSKPARAIAIILLFIPGAGATLAVHAPETRGLPIYDRMAFDATCTALKDALPEDRIATAQIHNHPALMCGHPLVAGYAGVLWAMGTNSSFQQTALTRMMKGDPDWRSLARVLKARYLYWGPSEIGEYAGSTTPWEKENVKILAQGEWGKIFDLRDL